MRKLMGMAGMFVLTGIGIGCQSTGGICDCAPVPGDSVGANPHVTYHATCPTGPAPTAQTSPVSTDLGAFEGIALPKSLSR